MKKSYPFVLLICLGFFGACTLDHVVDPYQVHEELDKELRYQLSEESGGYGINTFKMPGSEEYHLIPQDPRNPITSEKVVLGKLLYHETGMATKPKLNEGMYTYSCASCHHVDAGFQAGRAQGVGDGGQGFGLAGEGRHFNPNYSLDSLDVQPIRSPSALNIAYQSNVLWNGMFGANGVNAGTESQWTAGTPKETNFLGYDGTETQAIAGLKVHRMHVDTTFVQEMNYKYLFDEAFYYDPVPQRYDRVHAGLAIAAYERTLLANESPFQRWLEGESLAMSEQEKRGAILFFGKAGCVSCHSGPALNSMEFHALGMDDLAGPGVYGAGLDDATKRGRGGFTGNEEDDYKFKVPQLYNLKNSPFYGHGGNFYSLREVVEYKNAGVAQNAAVPSGQLANEFKPLNLSSEEMDEIVAFLETGLYDPNLERYVPRQLPSSMCFPNGDDESKSDLGCN